MMTPSMSKITACSIFLPLGNVRFVDGTKTRPSILRGLIVVQRPNVQHVIGDWISPNAPRKLWQNVKSQIGGELFWNVFQKFGGGNHQPGECPITLGLGGFLHEF